jgi:adenylate kinase
LVNTHQTDVILQEALWRLFFILQPPHVLLRFSRKLNVMSDKIEVENVNHPGHITRVDAMKYAAAKTALLAILSGQEQGLTQTEMMAMVKVQIDQTLFPNGVKSGWWMKTVQLDL